MTPAKLDLEELRSRAAMALKYEMPTTLTNPAIILALLDRLKSAEDALGFIVWFDDMSLNDMPSSVQPLARRARAHFEKFGGGE